MARILSGVIFSLILSFLLCGTLLADSSVVIEDSYIGATATHRNYSGDVIGSGFGVDSMSVTYSDSGILTVSITGDYFKNVGSYGTQLGDLFISTDGWAPYGDALYKSDNMYTGEDWEYSLVLDSHTYESSSGTIGLYSIENDEDIISSDEFHAGATLPYRKYQEVQLDTTDLTALAAGTWEISGNTLNLTIDTGATFSDVTDFGFHWCMSCGNDVIEGSMTNSSPVPEPGLITLLGLGMMGLVAVRRRG